MRQEGNKTHSFADMLEYLDLYPASVILEKAKSCYKAVRYSKYSIPDHNCKLISVDMIVGMKNKQEKIVNYIQHRDDSLTLITENKYYLRFTNQIQ